MATDPMNPFEQSASYLGQAGDAMGNVASTGVLDNINSYINPYYEQVLNTSLGRMQTQQNQAINQIGDNAIQAGAFDSGRHGVVEGISQGQYNKNVGDLTANVQANAFNTAAGLSQQDLMNQMNAGQGLQSLGNNMFGIGNQLNQQQMIAGQQQQDLSNQVLQGGQQQFNQQMNAPYQIIDMLNALAGSDPRRGAGSGQQSSTPGLFDYLSLAAGVGGAWLGS